MVAEVYVPELTQVLDQATGKWRMMNPREAFDHIRKYREARLDLELCSSSWMDRLFLDITIRNPVVARCNNTPQRSRSHVVQPAAK